MLLISLNNHAIPHLFTGVLLILFLLATSNVSGQTDKPSTPERSLLQNSFIKLTKEKRLKIVVIGNSVSHGAPFGENPTKNYSYYMLKWFEKQFPDAKIDIKMSIIFAIGPEIQLFRMEDKLFIEKPNLVVMEFGAANGAWGDGGREITERATEGYLRRLRFMLPQADCLMNMGIFYTMMDEYKKGKTPNSVLFQYDVAKHYGSVLADSEKVIKERVMAGEKWETYMNDYIHPSPAGHELYGQVIAKELDREYAIFQTTSAKESQIKPHTFPQQTVRTDCWLFPRLTTALFADDLKDFHIAENGRVKFIAANKPGASGSFSTNRGKIVGMLMHSPQKRGNLEVRLDNKGEWVRLSQKNEPRFTEEDDPANYLQRNFFGVYGLPLYAQRVDFRVSANPEDKDCYDVHIIGFLVIERDPEMTFSRP
jgi:hypothetical protein